MSDGPEHDQQTVAIVGDSATGEVTAQHVEEGVPVGQPGHFVASIMWLVLVVVLAVVVLAATLTLILLALTPKTDAGVSPETILLLFSSALGMLLGLYTQRPGSR